MDTIPSIKNLNPSADNDNADGNNQLQSIDDLFEGQGPYSEEFSVNELTQVSGSAVWKPPCEEVEEKPIKEDDVHTRVDYRDLFAHHRSAFPQVHHPLKPTYHRKGRSKPKKHPKADNDDSLIDKIEDVNQSMETEGSPSVCSERSDTHTLDGPVLQEDKGKTLATPGGAHGGDSPPSSDDEATEMSMLISPQISRLKPCIRSETDTGGSEDDLSSSFPNQSKKGRVQFDIGSDAADSEQEQKKTHKHRKRKHSHHHKHRRRSFEDPAHRRHLGNEKIQFIQPFTFTTTEEEAIRLREHELNEISTHRFEAKAVRRRHSIKAKTSFSSIIHPSKIKESPVKKGDSVPVKKTFDHNPHEVFVELAELQPSGFGGLEWKETARWIKYEEDVEGANHRWGKPHIAFLNFNALFSLRKGLERGAILLDLDEHDLPRVATRVVDHMVSCDQIPSDQRDSVIGILLLRHKHIKEGHHTFRRSSRGSKLHLLGASDEKLNNASSPNLDGKNKMSLANILHASTFANFGQIQSDDGANAMGNGHKIHTSNSYTQIEMESDTETQARPKHAAMNKELLKKLPRDAEATAVLVGAVDFLKQPTIAFVRLAEGVVMENVIEVNIPIRFLFVLLGPYNEEMDYHEVGRAISTLMSDKAFHEVAYKAHTRGQLLTAINDFLNASIVFPPSEWKNDDLIPIDEIKAKAKEMIKKAEDMKAKRRYTQITEKPDISPKSSPEDSSDSSSFPRDPLQRKGKLFHGLIQDVKIRYSQYVSDFRDGLSAQVLSACIFIFFAALSPTITFGGMYSDLTDKYIGVGETLLVSSINGAIFALFAAQPLLIVGATGPLMIFDISLLQFCTSMGLDYLSIRVWVGIWILLIGLVVAAFELVAIVKKFTRFTEEIFSTLVCFIFIYGAFEKLGLIFKKNPLMSTVPVPHTGVNVTALRSLLHAEDFDEDDELIEDGENHGEQYVDALLNNSRRLNQVLGTSPPTDAPGVNEPNTALLSMCMMLGTFAIAWKLKKFRNSKYLGRGVRRALGDFGVPIAIFVMVLIDWAIHDTYTDKLSMPSGLQPSNADVRGWLINPLGVVEPLPVWCMLAAGPAALLLFVLIFIEENICHLILSRPERCLKKGSGFHLDLVLSCLINTVSGFLGAPFMGPACVRTIAHASALTVMSSNVPPGESPKIIGCIEQRVSALTVSILVGLSVMLYAILNLVPTSVLLGIFLYMGISATAGIQLLERVILFFMPVKHHPNVPFVRKVRTRKMHLFTTVQLFMLVILWVVKQSPAALAIPFVLICLIPLRLYILPLIFTNVELIALDGKDQTILDEPDFYETAHDLPTQIEKESLA